MDTLSHFNWIPFWLTKSRMYFLSDGSSRWFQLPCRSKFRSKLFCCISFLKMEASILQRAIIHFCSVLYRQTIVVTDCTLWMEGKCDHIGRNISKFQTDPKFTPHIKHQRHINAWLNEHQGAQIVVGKQCSGTTSVVGTLSEGGTRHTRGGINTGHQSVRALTHTRSLSKWETAV